jgi:hypothetical protein
LLFVSLGCFENKQRCTGIFVSAMGTDHSAGGREWNQILPRFVGVRLMDAVYALGVPTTLSGHLSNCTVSPLGLCPHLCVCARELCIIIIADAHQGIKNTFPSLCLYTLILLSSVLTVICSNELKWKSHDCPSSVLTHFQISY